MIKPNITRQSEDNYLVEYTPKMEGLHSVNVFFAGQQIPNSPFGVMVGPRKYKNTNYNLLPTSFHGLNLFTLSI